MATAPQGWYPDPHELADERYWDGEAWTVEVRNSSAVTTGGVTTVLAATPSDVATAATTSEVGVGAGNGAGGAAGGNVGGASGDGAASVQASKAVVAPKFINKAYSHAQSLTFLSGVVGLLIALSGVILAIGGLLVPDAGLTIGLVAGGIVTILMGLFIGTFGQAIAAAIRILASMAADQNLPAFYR